MHSDFMAWYLVAVLEVSTKRWRNSWTSVLAIGCFVCQYLVNTLAQGVGDWRTFLLVAGLSNAMFIPYYW